MEKYSKWIEIDADAVHENYQAIRARLPQEVTLMAVVKNNAYGHGLVETARLLAAEGIKNWAVTWVEEALRLRQAGIAGEILLLAPAADEEETTAAIQNHITLCAASVTDIQRIAQAAQKLKIPARLHIKIDTGLSRFGFLKPSEIQAAADILSHSPMAQVTGAFTHMADAYDAAFTEKQFDRFMQAVENLRQAGINPETLHVANSGVFLKYPHMYLNMVRLGTLLCGQFPAGNYLHPFPLKDPYHYKTRIRSLRKLPEGSYLGYKRTWRLKKAAQIAVIPVGYSDGLALTVNNRSEGIWDLVKRIIKLILMQAGLSRMQLKVKIGSDWYPVRGKVFMQMALIELPENLKIDPDTPVEVPVSKTLASAALPREIIKKGPEKKPEAPAEKKQSRTKSAG